MVNVVNQPRPSMSLPNIALVDLDESPSLQQQQQQQQLHPSSSSPPSPPFSAPKDNVYMTRQRKRHSAELRNLVSIQDVNRHSFTFGHLPSTKSHHLTTAELTLPSVALAKLDRLVGLNDNTQTLLAQLGSTQPPLLVPHRSISHQHLKIPLQKPHQKRNRTHSESHFNTLERDADPIEPDALIELLAAQQQQQGQGALVTLIDVRNSMEYQTCRIRGSLNVNLPSLLVRRYRRGSAANFNLENFITTPQGREMYLSKKKQHLDATLRSVPPCSTVLEQKALKAQQNKKGKPIWIVYDDAMAQDDPTSQAWALLHVLKKNQDKVYYLSGGFQSFSQHKDWLETCHMQQQQQQQLSCSLPSAIPSLPTSSAGAANLKLSIIPKRSISYTIGESKTDLHKRTNLFSLDTQAARESNANALARRAERRCQLQTKDTNLHPPTASAISNSNNIHTSHAITHAASHASQHFLLNRVIEDDEAIMTADFSPRTESDFGFNVSEIIPGFLFVGPEIETKEHARQLIQERQIKRVLNMAEECQDEGLNHATVHYHKIAARDTLEMKNIELVMMEAVDFIDEAKKNHEPIYVHCKAGKSRSVTAILAYLVTSERWTLKKAYRHVIKARPNMSPNIGFISELVKMESQVHGRVSSFLESDWQSTSLSSPEYANESFQLEQAWQTATAVAAAAAPAPAAQV